MRKTIQKKRCQLQSSRSQRTVKEDSMCTSGDQVELIKVSVQISLAHVINPASKTIHKVNTCMMDLYNHNVREHGPTNQTYLLSIFLHLQLSLLFYI